MARRAMIGLGAAMVVSALAALVLMPDRYEAYSLLRVASNQDAVFGGDQRRDDFAVFKRTQVQLLLSPMVLKRALAEPEIATLSTVRAQADSTRWLKEHLVIDYPDDAEVMRVKLVGPAQDVVTIVNAVVKKYLTEVVYHEQQRKRDQEGKLTRLYEEYTRDAEKQLATLHLLERVNQTADTASAVVNKQMAQERLQDALIHRRDLSKLLRDVALKIKLEQAREEHGVKTADAEPPASDELWLLEKRKSILETELAEVDKSIERKAAELASLDSFSATVARKKDELRRLNDSVDQMGAELARVRVERLALERVMIIDPAQLESLDGGRRNRFTSLGLLAFFGVALVGIGMSRHSVA